jgi:hypothetical protein
MRQSVLLSDAPDRFFDPYIWGKIKAYAGQRYNALAMLNAPVPERQGDDFWGPVETDEQFNIRSRIAASARALTFGFRSGLCEGTYIAVRVCPPPAVRILVDRDLCRELSPMFATDSLRGINIAFMQVRVVEAVNRDSATQLFLEAVEDWLKARMVEGESSRKMLSHKAEMHFGDKLTNRIFDVAYKSVFARSRVAPQSLDKSPNCSAG